MFSYVYNLSLINFISSALSQLLRASIFMLVRWFSFIQIIDLV